MAEARPIEADDVPHKFDDARIKCLADIGELPNGANLQRYGDSVREAARIYARKVRESGRNAVYDEIERLHRAAARRKQKDTRVADLVKKLSPETRQRFETREATPGFERAGLKFPSVEDLRDPARLDEACDIVRRFCSIGGRKIEGRKRPSGKRSDTWQPLLYAPKRISHPPKREAELWFVMHLRLAWLEAVGAPPTATVDPGQSDRPFATLVRECLRLVGAGHADPVGLINELARRRRIVLGYATDEQN